MKNLTSNQRVNPNSSEIFRNELAKKYYKRLIDNANIYESGVDNLGNIYFAWLNGNIDRYSRKQFLKMSKENES